MGEGYHNFHHQFPMDYRNAFLWYQYDPTKWFIAICGRAGLASHLRVFPSNEIAKSQLSMKLKELKQLQDSLTWPVPAEKLPVISWKTCQFAFHTSTTRPDYTDWLLLPVQEEAKLRSLILIGGYVHDVSSFINQHPGGKHHLEANSGKEMTASFFGGVYTHSHAAHNVCKTFSFWNALESDRFLSAFVHDACRNPRWRCRDVLLLGADSAKFVYFRTEIMKGYILKSVNLYIEKWL